MISVEKALKIVLDNSILTKSEHVKMEHSLNRILAQDIYADRDFPPYNRVAMDGIAISFKAFEGGQREFNIEGTIGAGEKAKEISRLDACLEIMTGAILPRNLDTVIPYEQLDLESGKAKINVTSISQFQNIHRKGADRKEGDLLIKSGQKVSAAEIGILATVGISMVEVRRLPKAIIISTGDELVDINDIPKEHQIRKSNSFSIQALMESYCLKAEYLHLSDNKLQIQNKLSSILKEYELVIISGGVSMGKFDFLPEVLQDLGIELLFHKVKQRPGKPFWFGKNTNTTVFAFPGNPVSTFLCTLKYLIPWLNKSLELKEDFTIYAELAEDISFPKDLGLFQIVKLDLGRDTILKASSIKGNGSGDLMSLVEGDAFIELPEGKDLFSKGEKYRVLPYRNL